jgi:hypothetical protein
MEIHDAFLFSVPYRQNWHFATEEDGKYVDLTGDLEIVTQTFNPNTKTISTHTETEGLIFKED